MSSGGSSIGWQRPRLLDRNDMKRIKHIHVAFAGCDDDPFCREKNEFPVRHWEFGAVGRSDFERHKPALQPLADVLDRHDMSLLSIRSAVKPIAERKIPFVISAET